MNSSYKFRKIIEAILAKNNINRYSAKFTVDFNFDKNNIVQTTLHKSIDSNHEGDVNDFDVVNKLINSSFVANQYKNDKLSFNNLDIKIEFFDETLQECIIERKYNYIVDDFNITFLEEIISKSYSKLIVPLYKKLNHEQ